MEKKKDRIKWLQHRLNEAHHEEVGPLLFVEEYWTQFPFDNCQIALHPENRTKNLFPCYGLPYDHNRITSIPHYINASPMNFHDITYIAAQGPRETTSSDFWHMLWAENARLVVSVTNVKENREGKEIRKFHQFWPEAGHSQKYGHFELSLFEDRIIMSWPDSRPERIRLRRFMISDGTSQREVSQLHMENWLDGGVVHPESLFHLLLEAEARRENAPMIVHCAAGVGRTGTFIASHSLYQEMCRYLSQDDYEMHFNVYSRVQAMRKRRYGSMVGSIEQYSLVINTLQHALQQLREGL